MEKTKRCPYCGEEILAIAKKCKHCGEWLDETHPLKETKNGPACGESIAADAKVCPICNEPTYALDETETLSDTSDSKGTTVINDGHILYCKTCKEKISSSAQTCPNYGDTDPFYFDDITNKRKKVGLGCATIVILAIVMTFIFRAFGSKHGILTWSSAEFWIFVFVILGIWGLQKYFSYANMKEHRDEMDKIFKSKNDSQALEIWKKELEEKNNN